ncbi:MAG: prepilin-type N-terminal cleavage/methylation domain-containing protein [Fischerella sp.]|jgi:type IV pilus assembly protein PilA|uniref:type IV pilin protein n=1 Tax=Fischerella sp. TaxID=1191 RepID=UPI0017ADBFA1|nr:type IV pilin-like G/H family protein [Fischerella sp.]NWF57882.1 prepilin-type N-terminal cleavage/methylation domain-containing protein [Fischerella sp.]
MLKPELQTKFLKHLNGRKKKSDEGFTLIELLVVVIIIGVLAAIALPSLLNQVSKARQSEAKQNVGAMNRAQQAYYLENANQFADKFELLGIGLKQETDNYKYTIDLGATKDASKAAANVAASRAAKIKSYVGLLYTIEQDVNGIKEPLTQASVCEADTPYAGDKDKKPETVTVPDFGAGDCSKFATPKMKTVK